MARRRGNGAMWALLLAGGAWAWRNRDKIRNWAESNPQVRDKVNQLAQTNPQVRNLLEKQVGWQTAEPSGGSFSQSQGTGSGSSSNNHNAGTPNSGNYITDSYTSGPDTGTTHPASSSSGSNYNAGTPTGGSYTTDSYTSGPDNGTNHPATGETRRITPNDTQQDSRGSGI